ncbi:hypothetical protein V6Z11_D11G183400 [Gossypium hirsutum]
MMHVDRLCPLCKETEKSVDHLLRSCIVSKQTLASLKTRMLPLSQYSNYKQWLAMGFNQLADKEKEVLVIAYWVIWHAWNRLVHDGIKPNIPELVVFIKGYLIEIEALEGLRPSSFVPK